MIKVGVTATMKVDANILVDTTAQQWESMNKDERLALVNQQLRDKAEILYFQTYGVKKVANRAKSK